MTIERLFSKHPESVGETYCQHLCHALSFAWSMFIGCIVCAVHAFLPFLFETKGSELIDRLYSKMVQNRTRLAKPRVLRR